MKKVFLLAMASMLIFACSKEKNEGVLPEEKGMVIEVAAVNELSSGLATRTRPLYSEEALQEVERVNVHVFLSNGTNYLYDTTYAIPNWTKGTTFMRFTVPANGLLKQGVYQFLVVGQEATSNYTITTLTKSVTDINSVMASVASAGMESEIFAGVKDVEVSSTGVRVNMQMTRQVAGVLGYFKNVPATMNGTPVKFLRLSVNSATNNAASTGVLLANGNGQNPTGASYNVIDVDLSGQTVTSDGVFIGNDLNSQGVIKVANSELYGKFMLPVKGITMTLGLYDAGGNALKTWSVQSNGISGFDINANHFYALGQKVKKGDTTGGGTPGTNDDDAPIDLLLDQSISISIDPSWNMLHNLTIQ